MLRLPESSDGFCPYRSWLKIDCRNSRLTWFELLDTDVKATDQQIQNALALRRRQLQTLPPGCSAKVIRNVERQLVQAARVLGTAAGRRRYQRQVSYCSRFERIGDPQQGIRGTVVTECYDHTMDRKVAICRLRSAHRNPTRLRLFLSEARFFSMGAHPHLPAIHQMDKGMGIVVMEFLEYSLLEYAESLPNQIERVRFAEKVLHAGLSFLESLHRTERIHGGLGLHSFRATAAGEIRLVHAPVISPEMTVPVPDQRQTCQAPEMLTPDTYGQPGKATDLYMLGMLVIRLLAGGQLSVWIPAMGHSGKDIAEKCLLWHSSPLENLPSLKELMPELPQYLADVLLRMCEKRCSDRFADANEVLMELRAGQPTGFDQSGRRNETTQSATTSLSIPAADITADQQRSVQEIGGSSQLFHQQFSPVQQATSWYEVIQDPALIWQRLRVSRPLQCAVAMVVLIVVAVFVVEFPDHRQTGMISQNTEVVEEVDVPSKSESKLQTAASEGLSDILEDVQFTPGSETILSSYSSAQRLDHQEDLLEEEVLLELPKRRPVTSPVPPQQVTSVSETISAFSAIGLTDSDQRKLLVKKLRELRQRPILRSRVHRLFNECRELAPEDPRVPFVYAAAAGYTDADRSELELSVRLSPAAYTQPFRKLTELRLREWPQDSQLGDRILADMGVFCRQLAALPDAHERTFEWQWAGRVFGWLERHSLPQSGMSIVAHSKFAAQLRLLEGGQATEFRNGRDYSLHSAQIDPVFPLLPEVDIVLALESFSDEQPLLLGRKAGVPELR